VTIECILIAQNMFYFLRTRYIHAYTTQQTASYITFTSQLDLIGKSAVEKTLELYGYPKSPTRIGKGIILQLVDFFFIFFPKKGKGIESSVPKKMPSDSHILEVFTSLHECIAGYSFHLVPGLGPISQPKF